MHKARLGLAASALGMVLLTGCGGGDLKQISTESGGASPETAEGPSSKGDGKLSGTIVVSGSSTVFRISRAAQVGYNKRFPGVKVLVGSPGTGGGFGRYLEGEVDIVDASRTAKAEEESKAKELGFDWTRFTVGYDGITIVVNPQNTFLKSLTVEQLERLFEPKSTVQTWKDLDPSWPARKIILYTPDNDSGTYEFFVEAIIGRTDGQLAQRKDIQASSDDNILVTGVSGDADALGYFGYAYYAANQAKLRAVPIQNGPATKPVAPSPETILDQSYQPLARPLFIYVKNKAMERPEVAHFLRFYIENLNSLVKQARYVPPPDTDQQANLAALPPAPSSASP